jgi:membrane glycosyltransferase
MRDGTAAGGDAGLAIVLRRALFFTLVAATSVALLALATFALSPGGIGAIDLVLLLLFAATLPWQVTGLWNATIGFLIMCLSRDPVAQLLPDAARVRGDSTVTAKTAILVCIRNEAPDRVVRNLATLTAGLFAGGVADLFRVYVLSDTTDPAIAAAEERVFGALADDGMNGVAVVYRRRTANAGFKAGNIGDFCERWGAEHEFALVLDTDSLMSAEAVLQLVRVMQVSPKLGILQSLVTGLPSTSAFARLFQFGMRLGMRSYTIGGIWWQADCGPYWGHNAIIRLAPFMAYCQLPELSSRNGKPDHILSHDQVEAVLMRRAGYEVRVLPQEQQSWEENPATLLEFIRRDLRWCRGNMQYWRLLGLPGIKPISRYQFAFAIMMFIGSPAWIGLLVVGTAAVARSSSPTDVFDPIPSAILFGLMLAALHWPKLATFVHVLAHPNERKSFGGAGRATASMLCEFAFSFLLFPIMWFEHTMFLLRLPFARLADWSGQLRDDHTVPLRAAWRALWPQTLLGIATIAILAHTHPAAIPYVLPLAAGLALAVPFATVSAMPRVGAAFVELGIGRLPEETTVPEVLHPLALPAIIAVRPSQV